LRHELSRPCRNPAAVALLSSAATIAWCLVLAAWHTSHTQEHSHSLYTESLARASGCAHERNQAAAGIITLQTSDGSGSVFRNDFWCVARNPLLFGQRCTMCFFAHAGMANMVGCRHSRPGQAPGMCQSSRRVLQPAQKSKNEDRRRWRQPVQQRSMLK